MATPSDSLLEIRLFKQTRMSRLTRLPLSALLLGLLTTLAIAWYSAAFVPLRQADGVSTHIKSVRHRDPARGEGEGCLLIDRWRRPGAEFYEVWVTPERSKPEELGAGTPEQVAGFWARQAKLPWIAGVAPWPQPGATDTRFVESHGWPLPALWCTYQMDWDSPEGASGNVAGGVPFKNERILKGSSKAIRFHRSLPLRPHLLGLAADVALFAGAWYGALRFLTAISLGARRDRIQTSNAAATTALAA